MAPMKRCHCGRPIVSGQRCFDCEKNHIIRQQDDEFGLRYAVIRDILAQGLFADYEFSFPRGIADFMVNVWLKDAAEQELTQRQAITKAAGHIKVAYQIENYKLELADEKAAMIPTE